MPEYPRSPFKKVGTNIITRVSDDSLGLGITSPDTILQIKNDNWFSGKNYAGTSALNLVKPNVDDEINVGGSLILGSIEAAEDSGPVTLVDMPVSATPAAGSEMSFLLKIDGDGILKIYAEADSAGGIQNPSVRPQVPVVYDQTPQTLTGAGAVNLTTQITHVDTTGGAAALTLADGVEGQDKFIVMTVDVGAGTLMPTNLGGANTTITFDDVGDTAHLLFTDGAWQFMGGTATLA